MFISAASPINPVGVTGRRERPTDQRLAGSACVVGIAAAVQPSAAPTERRILICDFSSPDLLAFPSSNFNSSMYGYCSGKRVRYEDGILSAAKGTGRGSAQM